MLNSIIVALTPYTFQFLNYYLKLYVLALVDEIGYRFTDIYGRKHVSGSLTRKTGGPATVIYSEWDKDYLIGVHEFFHTLGLSDLEYNGLDNRLMCHLGRVGSNVTNNERQ